MWKQRQLVQQVSGGFRLEGLGFRKGLGFRGSGSCCTLCQGEKRNSLNGVLALSCSAPLVWNSCLSGLGRLGFRV